MQKCHGSTKKNALCPKGQPVLRLDLLLLQFILTKQPYTMQLRASRGLMNHYRSSRVILPHSNAFVILAGIVSGSGRWKR